MIFTIDIAIHILYNNDTTNQRKDGTKMKSDNGFDLPVFLCEKHGGTYGNMEGLELDGSIWRKHYFDIIDGEDNPDMIGEAEISCLNLERMADAGIGIDEAFDSISQEIADYYEAIFTRSGKIRKNFLTNGVDEFAIDISGAFHVLEILHIGNVFKGHGLAKEVTKIYLQNFARNTDLVFFQAFPLQHSKNERMVTRTTRVYMRDFVRNTEKADQAKLADYYERIGFPRIGKTEYFFGTAEHFLYCMRTAETD